jgi:arabinose-5-phosphate isomerase
MKAQRHLKAARKSVPSAAPSAAQNAVLELARKVLAIEAEAVAALVERLDERFLEAVEVIHKRSGRVIVSGIGKSGHIARKIASTMASTGTPAYFVHAAEASHGDLGMIEAGDVFIAISYSGTSAELLEILPLVKRRGAKLIAITGNPASPLAREADINLDAAVAKEACPHNLSPTASTTAALALGDALAVALLDAKGFSAGDFAHFHPRGQLAVEGRSTHALLHVAGVMRTGEKIPKVVCGTNVKQAVLEMSRGKMGMTAVLGADGAVKGVFTDGDLRRALEKDTDIDKHKVDDVMTPEPKTIRGEMLATEAVHLMEQHKINQLLVVDARGVLVGALNMHDLFRAKVI